MSNGTTAERYRIAAKIFPYVCALILIGASGNASAQWLEKLKNVFGGGGGGDE